MQRPVQGGFFSRDSLSYATAAAAALCSPSMLHDCKTSEEHAAPSADWHKRLLSISLSLQHTDRGRHTHTGMQREAQGGLHQLLSRCTYDSKCSETQPLARHTQMAPCIWRIHISTGLRHNALHCQRYVCTNPARYK